MFNKIHKSIKRSLIVFSVTFVVSTSAVALTYIYLDDLSSDEIKSRNTMRLWKNKITNAKINNETIVAYEKPYLKLIDQNIVGDENRLSWFETLQSTASTRGLEIIRFTATSQVKVNPKELEPIYKNIDIYKSVMKLEMKMAHEGDIFAVFNDLDNSAKGLYSVNNCRVEKLKKNENVTNKVEAEMKASCELSWYTFKPFKTKG